MGARRLAAVLLLAGLSAAGPAQTAAPELRAWGAGEGRFTIYAPTHRDFDARAAQALTRRAWSHWSGPLFLPERWPDEVAARLVEITSETSPRPDQPDVWMRTDGVVVARLWLSATPEHPLARERRWLLVLAEAAWRRQMLGLGPTGRDQPVPGWLVAGAAELVLQATNPSARDAWRANLRATAWQPRLDDAWNELDPAAPSASAHAFALWTWTRAELAASDDGWATLVRALVRGEAFHPAFLRIAATSSPDRSPADLELKWQTDAASYGRTPAEIWLDPESSRRLLEEADRLLVVGHDVNTLERAIRLSTEWTARRDPNLTAERTRRSDLLARLLGRVHPFYRNAAISLGRAWLALDSGREVDWRRARDTFEADFRAGLELETLSRARLGAPGG